MIGKHKEFVEAYNDYRKYLDSILELLQNLALEYLILGAVEKTMNAIFEIQRNGMCAEEAFGIYSKMECSSLKVKFKK